MRPFSLYLNEVKNSKSVHFEMDLAASTPPAPIVPKALFFDAEESRRSPASQLVLKQISNLTGVRPERLMLTMGSSSGFLLALSAITQASDTVLIEQPTYEPFVMTAKYLGLKVKRFQRTGHFKRDLQLLEKARGQAKVLVISNPNAPTGWLYSQSEISRLAKIFEYVIVDEIFLPVFTGEVSRVAKASNLIALSGLSKTLGLSSLRIGWIQASAKILKSCDQIALNMYCDLPTLSLVGASAVIPRWHEIVEGHRARVDLNRDVLKSFDRRFPGVASHDFSIGHYGVLKIPKCFSSASSFAKALQKYSIKVCACEPFDRPDAIRISAWGKPEKFKKAMELISEFYSSDKRVK